MKYVVVQRGDELSQQLTARFHTLAAGCGMTESEEEPDTIVTIGGDGTMLHAFHRFRRHLQHASFVGVHTGHLGFFADWMPGEIETLVQLMAAPSEGSKLRLVEYPLVEVEMTGKDGQSDTFLALNEFTVKGIDSTLVAQLNINDELFEMFRGDGICISTPCGSTAYNKSLGGALLHPSLESIQIAEISSINNRVYRTLGSSMILPKHHHCDIYPKSQGKLLLSVDYNHSQREDIVSLRCQVSPEKVRFARYRPFPFWSRVREAFIGHDVQ
ncbi:NAD kinase [Gorillibacterium sp. sgz5001074]|uniref:NAD kinase n=1 Tax=Gorillibacterium sp. sgz5001074 TaxID=3446695 RepID=UPI003F674BF7